MQNPATYENAEPEESRPLNLYSIEWFNGYKKLTLKCRV